MDLVCWNVRGAACTSFRNNVVELIRTHHLDLLFICEPRISGKKALDMAKSLGFSSYEIVDPVGFSGGLWLLWNDNKINIQILGTTDQAITSCVSWHGQAPWILTTIYAKPCASKRAMLWDYLNFVASCHQLPWILAGDFNEMLFMEDKLGGANPCRLKGFNKWFTENDMIDLGYSGPKFTWTNNRVFERLDRAVCNLNWMQMFPDANVLHIPRTKSDHCPIKICLQSRQISSPIARPFRFEAMWMQHGNFKDFVTQKWGQIPGSALDKSYGLIPHLKQWNHNIFGHLKRKKTLILARLDGIQKALCHCQSTSLFMLEDSLV
ncbi:uncharacterized protein LOC110765197 [Prunus avium]|uniref:Uncharacterized protein LOC110765197 n=1 Tax=Prunus avium TaxID=42229 RepID=A0A6P5T9U6_PRUAV|nr:uncharacterized protein LOC110765197 [Prunus avium]